MAHPDSIKVVVEDAANISVTSSPTLGNVAVTPETPAVIAINTNSAQITLAELIGGDPEDGQVIVYDSTTNTFYYDYSSGGSGALVSDLQVTNKDSAVGDSVGVLYEQNDSHESIIRDILSPNSPVVRSAKINWQKVSSGFKVPSNVISRITSIVFEFMFPEKLTSSGWTVTVDGNQVAVNNGLPADYGSSVKSTVEFSGSGIPATYSHGEVTPIKISSTYDDNGVEKPFHYEDNIYHGRGAFIAATGEDGSAPNIMDALVAYIKGYGVPDSEESDGYTLVLNGSVETQSKNNYTWLAIPSNLDVLSITEAVADEGVANRTFSFSRIGNLHTYPLVNGSYSVYLYRSNQKGALSENSSLVIKLNRS